MKKRLIDSVLPKASNAYTPSLLQKVAMGAMAFLVVLSFTATNILAVLWQSSDWLVGAVLPGVVATLTNDQRLTQAEAPLIRSRILDEAATLKAQHMAAESYFAHYSPGGISPWYWFDQVGYTYTYAGENLAVHFTDSEEVVKAWMKSPSHRDNIINKHYTEIGIGTAKGTYDGYPTVFVVQLFGTPAEPAKLPPLIVSTTTLASSTEIALNKLPELLISDQITTNNLPPTTSVAVLGAETSSEEPKTNSPVAVAGDETVLAVEAVEPIEATPSPSYPANFEPTPVESVVAPTDLISTSTNLKPTTSALISQSTSSSTPVVARLATQPNKILQIIYIVFGSVTALLLLLSIILGWRKSVLAQVWYGVGLLLVISVLFAIHLYVTAGALII